MNERYSFSEIDKIEFEKAFMKISAPLLYPYVIPFATYSIGE